MQVQESITINLKGKFYRVDIQITTQYVPGGNCHYCGKQVEEDEKRESVSTLSISKDMVCVPLDSSLGQEITAFVQKNFLARLACGEGDPCCYEKMLDDQDKAWKAVD